jgi:hypothetical protein
MQMDYFYSGIASLAIWANKGNNKKPRVTFLFTPLAVRFPIPLWPPPSALRFGFPPLAFKLSLWASGF